MNPEIASYIAHQYFSLPEPRPFLVVQFGKNSDGLRALSVLNSEVRSAAAKFFVRDLAFIDAVLSSASWDVQRPIIRAQFLRQKTFENWVRDYSRGIEQISLVPEENLLNPLLTKPTKRADLAAAIIRETLMPELAKSLSNYGFTASGEILDFCGLPFLKFWVRCGQIVKSVEIGCWGGVISVTGEPEVKYAGPAQVREVIERVMDNMLDEFTR
jgi:hypothetical protein